MKQRSYEFRFYQDGVAAKLIVTAERTARVTAIVGSRVFRAHWFEGVEAGGTIRIGENAFSPSRIDCDLTLDGLRVCIHADLCASAAFASPLGGMSALGMSAYNLTAPVVFGAMRGSADFGGVRYNDRAAVSVDGAVGTVSEFRHSVVWGAREGNVFWMTTGENRTLWKNWRYAAAYVGTPRRVYELKGPTRATDFHETASGMSWTLVNPALKLDVRLSVYNETADSLGYRYATDCAAELTLSAGGRMTLLTLSVPSSLTHLGMVRAKAEETLPEATTEVAETAVVRNSEQVR